MSTEGVMLRDGTCVAAADYSAKQYFAVGLTSGTARSVTLASVAGQGIYGILQNKPKAGQVADVAFSGVTKAVVAAAGVTAGAPVMVTATGAVTDWTATGNKQQVGFATEAGASGQIIQIVLAATGNTTA